ncbi:MAG: hypothetical protein ACOC8O_00660, partial [Natronomonas sp.]
YDVIEVPPGDMYTKSLDEGEVWENKLIDVSNNGAAFRLIVTVNGDATVRNIGLRGKLNNNDYDSNMITAYTSDPNGVIKFENCYFGDGFETDVAPNVDPSGMSLRPNHAGYCLIDGFTMREFADNALYLSPAGHNNDRDVGNWGPCDVRNAYFEDNKTSDIRPGTDGTIENVGCYGNENRGIWCNKHPEDEGQYIKNAHVGPSAAKSGPGRSIAVGNSGYEDGLNNWAELLEGVHVESGTLYTYNPGNEIRGSPESYSPQYYADPNHFGAPASAEEAASGESGDGGGDPGEPFEVDDIAEDFEHDDLGGHYHGDTGNFDIIGGS